MNDPGHELPSGPRVRLLTRSGCHLCEEAEADLAVVMAEFPGAQVELVDIESDDRLHREHLERIPVVEVDGREVCVIFFDAGAVRDALAAGRVR
ncbi:MAG: glutaredoxin family protein [Actinomycetota bacterium]|nr:glutaredoxin family protein [Actinomycetota bacterium]